MDWTTTNPSKSHASLEQKCILFLVSPHFHHVFTLFFPSFRSPQRGPVPPGRAGPQPAGLGRLGQPHRADGSGAAGSGNHRQSGERGDPTHDWLKGGTATGLGWDGMGWMFGEFGGDLGLVVMMAMGLQGWFVFPDSSNAEVELRKCF